MVKPVKIYLSYSPQDADFARKLAADLTTGNRTADVSLDPFVIRVGETLWGSGIRNGIESSQLFLVLLSPASLDSNWVDAEVELAMSSGKPKVIPVVLDARAKSNLPPWLRGIQSVDLSTPELYASGLITLSSLINSVAKSEPD
jgi:hypothetical protein